MRKYRYLLPALLLVLLLALLLAAGGCGNAAADKISSTGFLLDTGCTITLYDPTQQELLTQCFTAIEEYEQLFSRTLEGSDVWRINHAQGQPTTVDSRTAELIRLALSYAELSGGAFDISIGRLSSLWNFGSNTEVPAAADIAAAQATVDYRRISVEGNSVTLSDPDAMLDLGGVAKGYIADQLAQLLLDAGVECAVIDLGGNVVTVGAKASGAAWSIGVEQPFSERTALVGVLDFSAEGSAAATHSIVTSGIYERNFTVDDVLYHHILDPATGYPAQSDVCAVSIISASSALGDALSTACLLLGYEQGGALLDTLIEAGQVQGAIWQLQDGSIVCSGDLPFTPPSKQAAA